MLKIYFLATQELLKFRERERERDYAFLCKFKILGMLLALLRDLVAIA